MSKAKPALCFCGKPAVPGCRVFFEGVMVQLCSGHFFDASTRAQLRAWSAERKAKR